MYMSYMLVGVVAAAIGIPPAAAWVKSYFNTYVCRWNCARFPRFFAFLTRSAMPASSFWDRYYPFHVVVTVLLTVAAVAMWLALPESSKFATLPNGGVTLWQYLRGRITKFVLRRNDMASQLVRYLLRSPSLLASWQRPCSSLLLRQLRPSWSM
jgi:hypothetical protein